MAVPWSHLVLLEQADAQSDEATCEHDRANERKIDYGAWLCRFGREHREEKSGKEKYGCRRDRRADKVFPAGG